MTSFSPSDAEINDEHIETRPPLYPDQYREIINAMNDTVWVIDLNGLFLDVNDTAVKALGYTREELMSMTPKDIDAYLTKEMIVSLINRMPEEKKQLFETVHRTKTGEMIPVQISSSIVTYRGKPVVLSIARDITQRKQAEAEINRQLHEKKTLLKEVHHRIKNNIASIESLLSLKIRSTNNPETLSILKDAMNSMKSMRLVYEKLLLGEDYQKVNIKHYVNELVDAILHTFHETFAVSLHKDIDDFYLDTYRLFPLGSIINELITNSMKYAFQGKDSGEIRITIKKKGNLISLTVSDNGRGFPDTPKDTGEKKSSGLMLVHMLAQQLDATFSRENRNGTVSTLSFSI